MKLIFCDKNKELVREVKNLFDNSKSNRWNAQLEAVEGDILKLHDKEKDSILCTASNPDFDMAGGLDLAIQKKYRFAKDDREEFSISKNVLFLISVDESRKSNIKEIKRALSYIFLKFNNTNKTILLTGIGTAIGGMLIKDFISLIQGTISADLRYADLSSADLSYANLRSANLSSADLSYANLSYADLRSADLSSADLRSANLRYANLSYADLRSADLSSADLRSANLSSADLSSADLSYANLRSANLISADLRSANLRYANLRYANLSYANLSYADLRSADLSSADLSSADLRYANLSSANLSSADLRYANLSSADLRITEFDGLTVREFIEKYDIKKNRVGVLLMYKGVSSDNGSPVVEKGKKSYVVGKTVSDKYCSFSVQDECKPGLHVCPTVELAKEYGNKVLEVGVDIMDFVAIPNEGRKVRVKRLKVLREVI